MWAIMWLLPLAASFLSTATHAVVQAHIAPSVALRRAGLLPDESRPHEVGNARYPDKEPILDWGDMSGKPGQLGAVCNRDEACGDRLVCHKDVCRHCTSSDQCPFEFVCVRALDGANMCASSERRAWERAVTELPEFICSFLIFFCAALAAAAGTGGGGMFVPLLLLFSGLKGDLTVPLSQCMILFGSTVNLLVFSAQRHPLNRFQPKIDYDCIVLLEPMLCLGVTLGVLLHQMTPQVMQVALLIITLLVALWRTAGKGVTQWQDETAKANGTPRLSPRGRSDSTSAFNSVEDWLAAYRHEFVKLTNAKALQVIGIIVVWCVMLAASFHGLPICSGQYVLYLAILSVLAVLGTALIARFVVLATSKSTLSVREGTKTWGLSWIAEEEGPVTWKPIAWVGESMLSYIKFPCIALAAGLLGGLLGIGGGIIISPVLLEVGMHSEAVQATTAVFVLLSSSLATIQYALLHQHVWHYALWYSSLTVVATCFGQHMCDTYVRKYKRYSMITLSIAGVLLFSMLALSVVGVMEVMDDVRTGHHQGFSLDRLCYGHGVGIVAVDVQPAQAWPAGLPHIPHGQLNPLGH